MVVVAEARSALSGAMHVNLDSISCECSNRPDINNNGLSYYQVVATELDATIRNHVMASAGMVREVSYGFGIH